MSASRAERRRQQRAHAKQPVLIAGDGVAAAELAGHRYEAKPHADLAAKVPGVHRWIAAASWVVDVVQAAHDADTLKFLDHENLMHLSIGCWDCEQPLGVIQPDTPCAGSVGERMGRQLG